MLKILIPEQIPAQNKGEEAILRGTLQILNFATEKKVYLYSKYPVYDQRIYGEQIETITKTLITDPNDPKWEKFFSLFFTIPQHFIFAFFYRCNKKVALFFFRSKLWKIYDSIDCVLAGHDSAFTISHNFLILFCKAIKKPIFICSTSILPFLHKKEWIKILTCFSLNLASLITAREEVTYDILKNVIKVKKAELTADKAFLLDPLSKKEAFILLKRFNIEKNNSYLIGMTIRYGRGILDRVGISKDEYLDIIANFVDSTIKYIKNVQIVFFPHSIGPSLFNDDRVAARKIFERCNQKESIKLIEEDLLATQLKSMIGCCDFFVGERTHSVIGAFSMLVPAICLSYSLDYRTEGIIGRTLCLNNCIYYIDNLRTMPLLDFFTNAWLNRESIKNLLISVVPSAIERSWKDRDFLVQVLNKTKSA